MKKVIVILTLAISLTATPALASGGKRPDPLKQETTEQQSSSSLDFFSFFNKYFSF